MPVWNGCFPPKTAAREGEQRGAAQWALATTTPRFARRSRCGVLTCGCPPRKPTQSFRSSAAMNNTLGRSRGSSARDVRPPARPSTAASARAIVRQWVADSHCIRFMSVTHSYPARSLANPGRQDPQGERIAPVQAIAQRLGTSILYLFLQWATYFPVTHDGE